MRKQSMLLPTLSTKRLLLRPWRASDLTVFAEINADPQVMAFYAQILSREESDALVDKIQEEWTAQGYGFWAVEVPGVADFIGFIGLNYWNRGTSFSPCIDIGWRLGSRYWGKGYATEGAREVLRYGFDTLKLPEIVSMATIKNTRSQQVMQRLGMTTDPAENFEHPQLPRGHPLSWRVLYRLTFCQWSLLKIVE